MFKKCRIYFLLGILALRAPLALSATAEEGTGDFRIAHPSRYTRAEAGNDLIIQWANASYSAKNLFRLRIELFQDGKSIHVFTDNTFNTGEHTSLLLSTIPAGTYQIKITSVDETAHDFSDPFAVIAPIPIKILQPTASTIWNLEEEVRILWQDDNPLSIVYINLFKVQEEGQLLSVEKIADDIDNAGEYTYKVNPELVQGEYVVGIRIPPIPQVKYSKPFIVRSDKKIELDTDRQEQ